MNEKKNEKKENNYINKFLEILKEPGFDLSGTVPETDIHCYGIFNKSKQKNLILFWIETFKYDPCLEIV